MITRAPMVIEFWPHVPDVRGSTPSIGREFFNFQNFLLPIQVVKSL